MLTARAACRPATATCVVLYGILAAVLFLTPRGVQTQVRGRLTLRACSVRPMRVLRLALTAETCSVVRTIAASVALRASAFLQAYASCNAGRRRRVRRRWCGQALGACSNDLQRAGRARSPCRKACSARPCRKAHRLSTRRAQAAALRICTGHLDAGIAALAICHRRSCHLVHL